MTTREDKPPFPKLRETSNLSSPENLRDSFGQLLAVNANIDLERDFAAIPLPTTASIRLAETIVNAGYHRIIGKHPDAAHDLRPTAWKSDGEAYFRQFPVRQKNVSRQMKFDKPAGAPMRALQSTSLQFGGRPGPHIAQRFTNATSSKITELRQEWNNRVMNIAETSMGPTPACVALAQRLAPPEYRRWLKERRSLLGADNAISGTNQGYIDDEMG
jgi:hypothetical protein